MLLGKTAFELPETDSPAPMPEWFPVRGGEIAKIKIEDLCWKALAPLDAEEVRCDELCVRIFALETAIVGRRCAARRRDPAAGDGFFARICPVPPPLTADEFLTQAQAYLQPSRYRAAFARVPSRILPPWSAASFA